MTRTRKDLSYPERVWDSLYLLAREGKATTFLAGIRRVHRHGQRDMRERIIDEVALSPGTVAHIRALKVR